MQPTQQNKAVLERGREIQEDHTGPDQNHFTLRGQSVDDRRMKSNRIEVKQRLLRFIHKRKLNKHKHQLR